MSGWAAATRAGWLVAQLGWMKLGPRPSPRVFATRLLPVVAFTAGSLYFGNVAYLSLSVAFIQILKACAPPPLPSRHVGGGAWCGLACVLAVLLQLPPWAHALHAPAGACSAHVAPMA